MTGWRALIVDDDRGRAEALLAELGQVGVDATAGGTAEELAGAKGNAELVLTALPQVGAEVSDAPTHPYLICDLDAFVREDRLQADACLLRPLSVPIIESVFGGAPGSEENDLSSEQLFDLCRISLLGGVNSVLGFEPFVSAVSQAFQVDGCVLSGGDFYASVLSDRTLSEGEQLRIAEACRVGAHARVPTIVELDDGVVSICAWPVNARGGEGALALLESGFRRFSTDEWRALEALTSRIQHELALVRDRDQGRSGRTLAGFSRRPRNVSGSPDHWTSAATEIPLGPGDVVVDDDDGEGLGIASGTTLGGYRIHDRISRGAMGTVYRGQDLTLGRPVAVKVLRPDLARDGNLVSRFRKEARILASLRHPNLVHIYSFGVEKGLVYFIMELVEGMAVSDLIFRSSSAGEWIDAEVVIAIVDEVAEALDEIHRVNIVHRDVKPENVLLDRINGRAVLVDVGVAKGMNEAADIAGTPGFTAPECFREGEETSATDVYGLAATCYAMLTGRQPFAGKTVHEVLHSQRHRPPAPASGLRPDLSSAVDDVLQKALLPNKEDRYGSAVAFGIALTKALSR